MTSSKISIVDTKISKNRVKGAFYGWLSLAVPAGSCYIPFLWLPDVGRKIVQSSSWVP